MTTLALDLRSYPGESHAHDHPYHQVIFALEGGLDMEIGGRAGRVDSVRENVSNAALKEEVLSECRRLIKQLLDDKGLR